jgi:hypothetical protein
VHQLGRTEADVTEGSGGIWERLHYDWSDPNHVVLTTTDSNLWSGGSGHTTHSRVRPTESPTLTLWSSAKERISRDVYLALYWERSARAFWKRRLNKALRLSKPGTTPVESESGLELANTIRRARQFQSSYPFRRIEQGEHDGRLTTDSGECPSRAAGIGPVVGFSAT